MMITEEMKNNLPLFESFEITLNIVPEPNKVETFYLKLIRTIVLSLEFFHSVQNGDNVIRNAVPFIFSGCRHMT